MAMSLSRAGGPGLAAGRSKDLESKKVLLKSNACFETGRQAVTTQLSLDDAYLHGSAASAAPRSVFERLRQAFVCQFATFGALSGGSADACRSHWPSALLEGPLY